MNFEVTEQQLDHNISKPDLGGRKGLAQPPEREEVGLARSVRKEDMIAIAAAAQQTGQNGGGNRRCGAPLPSFLPLAPAAPSAPGLMNSNAFLVADEPFVLPSFPERDGRTDGRT